MTSLNTGFNLLKLTKLHDNVHNWTIIMHSFSPSDFEYCTYKKMQVAFMHEVTGDVSMYLFNLFVTCFYSIQVMLLSTYAAWFNPTQHMYVPM